MSRRRVRARPLGAAASATGAVEPTIGTHLWMHWLQIICERERAAVRARARVLELGASGERVGDALSERFRDDAAKAVQDAVLEEGETVYNIELRVQNESFGTLIVQLRALGLITRGQRKRSVNDRGTYWALTP